MPLKALLSTLLLLPPVCIFSTAQVPASRQDQINLHARLAEQYIEQHRPELAIPELRKVVALDPGNLDAHANLGVLLFFRRDYKNAIPQLRAAVKSDPNLWKLQALLGLAEEGTGDSAASQSDLEAAFPHLTDEKIHRQVGEALINEYTAKEELEKAAGVVSSLLAAQPTDTSLLYMSYRLYSDLAGKSMLTLALVSPDSAEMHQVMARELARQNDNAGAIANYRAAIKINPDIPSLHSELGDLLFHSEDLNLQSQAASEFKKAVELNPDDEHALLSLGTIAERGGDMKTAYADFSRALQLNPNDGDACTELAKVLIAMNQPAKAQQLFERAVEIDPTDDVAHYRLAALYRKAGQMEEAKQQVDLYLKYKQMKDKMEKIFHDMRVMSPTRPSTNDEKQ
jgi:tetratricopeptide (TPR) repeat protein